MSTSAEAARWNLLGSILSLAATGVVLWIGLTLLQSTKSAPVDLAHVRRDATLISLLTLFLRDTLLQHIFPYLKMRFHDRRRIRKELRDFYERLVENSRVQFARDAKALEDASTLVGLGSDYYDDLKQLEQITKKGAADRDIERYEGYGSIRSEMIETLKAVLEERVL